MCAHTDVHVRTYSQICTNVRDLVGILCRCVSTVSTEKQNRSFKFSYSDPSKTIQYESDYIVTLCKDTGFIPVHPLKLLDFLIKSHFVLLHRIVQFLLLGGLLLLSAFYSTLYFNKSKHFIFYCFVSFSFPISFSFSFQISFSFSFLISYLIPFLIYFIFTFFHFSFCHRHTHTRFLIFVINFQTLKSRPLFSACSSSLLLFDHL